MAREVMVLAVTEELSAREWWALARLLLRPVRGE